MPQKLLRRFLKDKEARALLGQVPERFRLEVERIFGTKPDVEVMETESAKIFLVNGKPLLAETAGKVFPTLFFNDLVASVPKVVVDMGAVPYVCKGANVMAPGIRRIDGEFGKGDFVFVADEKHGKVLALGKAMFDVDEARRAKQGAVIENVHFVGDRLWNLLKEHLMKAR